ncbi:hypothetical protein E2986_04136 [Frieseomelitta varia]|uniref:Dol-P-Glc:Glc(2)Man(9)GlcNAc(2)-PP-Dol alpha-1,2-glucosyltransferase n=1 Tax=Frieseomelitta varia TaxID=561572 RepID=A0A833W9K4_9HYME|nr:hypothetical protein E2986_04136 [Frieseomelitta varia]
MNSILLKDNRYVQKVLTAFVCLSIVHPITSSTRFFTCLRLCDIALVILRRYVSINFYCVLLVIGKVVENQLMKSFVSLYVFEGYWDPKITTLPGLYLIATLILSPLKLCNAFYMRCINLLGTFLNLYLAHSVIEQISTRRWKQKWNDWMKFTVACNVMLFPPLFFWHFLYYTDVASVNAVLLMLLLHSYKQFKTAAFVGLLSVLIRQTNIIWVAFITVEHLFDLLDHKISKSISYQQYTSIMYLKLLWEKVIRKTCHKWELFTRFIIQLFAQLFPYVIVCLTFVTFVIWNKGIVVGDKRAHVPTIHIPQLLYFSTFLFCFLWPYMIIYWKDYFKFVSKHWMFASCVLILLTVIVHFNTLVHPYMLADNRHYVFYFWNKLMGKYKQFKYLLVPVNYTFMISVVLIPQLLIEPRYFIVPYILYRLFIKKPKKWQIIAESATTLIFSIGMTSLIPKEFHGKFKEE